MIFENFLWWFIVIASKCCLSLAFDCVYLSHPPSGIPRLSRWRYFSNETDVKWSLIEMQVEISFINFFTFWIFLFGSAVSIKNIKSTFALAVHRPITSGLRNAFKLMFTTYATNDIRYFMRRKLKNLFENAPLAPIKRCSFIKCSDLGGSLSGNSTNI